MKAVLGVVLARCPRASAGHTCATMNWALTLRELGWDVWITEHVSLEEIEPPEAEGLASPQEEFWKETAKEFGFEGRECLIVDGKSPELEAMREFAAGADLFLNYSGQFKRLDLIGPRTRKAYLDVDPAFTQLWAEVYGSDMNFAGHDVFLTVGSNVNGDTAFMPHAGREWLPMLPPVAGADWRRRLGRSAGLPASNAAWTTVGHWYGYGDLLWRDRTFAGKRESLLALRELPKLSGKPSAIATDLKREWGDYDEFIDSGWEFLPSEEVCRDVPSYLDFLASSRGEIGIAKAGYVVSQGGWISDRSLVYLALGRPVVLQDTGWKHAVDFSKGMVPFQEVEDCARAIRDIEADYERHSKAALELAETLFSSKGTLAPMLSRIL